ncbi:ATP-binding protein [Nonomuraea sp. NPDC050663]|uniref:ATP-binding protein n=1 Tax=Nonomuraea sp. NPDC050663 TaxID=3364370 RepID=UPI00379D429D
MAEESFAHLLRRLRVSVGLTQEELAHRSTVSARSISDLERAIYRTARKETTRLLADALELSGTVRAQFEATARGRAADPALSAVLSLPAPLTSLVGREAEIAAICELLERQDVRLLTLTGLGGVGKTRLCLAVAQRLSPAFPEGVFFADLTAAGSPELALAAVAQAAGVRDDGAGPLARSLVEHLRGRQCLLVADNFEHLADRAAEILGGLLAECPGLTCLVTSRRTLRLRGGHEVAVRPLRTPDPSSSTAALAANPAVALFSQCVRAHWPGWRLEDSSPAVVARICARLEGLPLALELAAARMKVLTSEELLRRLTGRLALLSPGSDRQGGLRATLDWSHGLLDEGARALLARLSVFAGGWTLESVEEICGCELDDLATLVDNSLVHRSGTRFVLLETVREYAAELLGPAESAEMGLRHLDWFVDLAERGDRELIGAGQRHWLALLVDEQDNLRRAIAHALELGDATRAQRITGALWRFWEMHGRLAEGRRWLELALDLPGESPPVVRGLAFKAAGNLARDQGDRASARESHGRALEMFEAAGFAPGVATSFNNLANILLDEGDHEAAAEHFERSLERFIALGDRWNTALLRVNLALALRKTASTLDRAATLARESIEEFRGLGDERGEARAVEALARILDHGGDHRGGAGLHVRAVALRHAVGDRGGLARSMEGLAHALSALGEAELPAWLLGHAAAIRTATGDCRNADDEFEWQDTVRGLRERLGDAYDAQWTAGRAATTEEALSRCTATA